ncbi:hypothetical protein [Nonomuraea typhae]|uniref:hypothetical protein n=1 Tax=Nonomuraea typhae TaxID=2603600 RepID=UPI0012F9DF81|nr:hypothetical protein [Nonomuraea typhae]
MIPNEVWDRLNPEAALVRHGRAAMLGVVLAVLLAFAWSSIPRITQYDLSQFAAQTLADELGRERDPMAAATVTFVNDSFYPITLTGVGLRAEDVRLVAADFPREVAAGQRFDVVLGLEIGDCAAAWKEAPVVFRTSAWWGSAEVTAALEPPLDGSWLEFFRRECAVTP